MTYTEIVSTWTSQLDRNLHTTELLLDDTRGNGFDWDLTRTYNDYKIITSGKLMFKAFSHKFYAIYSSHISTY